MTKKKSAKETEERKARLAVLEERLIEFESSVDPLIVSQAFALHDGYSERNAKLIAMQKPGATDVCGYKAWLERNRCVRKGEKGIQILAPMTGRHKEETEESNDSKEDGKRWVSFRTAYVFDVSQTDPVEKQDVKESELECALVD